MSNRRGMFCGAYAKTKQRNKIWEIEEHTSEVRVIGEYDESHCYFTIYSLPAAFADQWDFNIDDKMKSLNKEVIDESINSLKEFVDKLQNQISVRIDDIEYHFGCLTDCEF